METQGRLKRARLDSAKKNSQLMETNIKELGGAEQRDSTVQTKVLIFLFWNQVFCGSFVCLRELVRCFSMWWTFGLALVHPKARF